MQKRTVPVMEDAYLAAMRPAGAELRPIRRALSALEMRTKLCLVLLCGSFLLQLLTLIFLAIRT